jgi:poly(hydroxyalkanoate) depolymerase family esterase
MPNYDANAQHDADASMPDGMREATRLTRAGQLAEATALIQRTLANRSGGPPPAGPSEASPRPTTPLRWLRRDQHAPASTQTITVPSTARPAWQSQNATTPPAGRFITASHSNRAGTRSYKLYVPAGADRRSFPLIVLLHGCTQNADDFAAGTRMNALAEANGFLVAYPQQSERANPSRCWNWFKAADQLRDGGEPSIIAGITREIAASHDVDDRRIYVAGMSAGAAMAVIMGSTYPDLYAAVGVHSGLAYGAASDLQSGLRAMKQGGGAAEGPGRVPPAAPGDPTPTIAFHGDKDRTVHRSNGEQVLRPWTARGARSAGDRRVLVTVHKDRAPGGHGYTRYAYRDADGRPLAEGWSVHGLGHAWSGGDASGTYTDPKGPDASAEMVRFFADVAAHAS